MRHTGVNDIIGPMRPRHKPTGNLDNQFFDGMVAGEAIQSKLFIPEDVDKLRQNMHVSDLLHLNI